MKQKYYRNSFNLLRRNFWPLMAFEFIYITLETAVIYPLLMRGVQFVLDTSDLTYVTMQDLIIILQRPKALGMLFLLLLFFSLYTLWEILVIVLCLDMSYQQEKVTLISLVKGSFLHIRKLFRPSFFVLAFAVFIGNFVIEIPIVAVFLSSSEVFSQIRNFFEFNAQIGYILIAVLIPLAILFFFFMFVLPFMIVENKRTSQSLRASMRMVKQNSLSVFFTILVGYAGILGILFSVYFGITTAAGYSFKGFAASDRQIPLFLDVINRAAPVFYFIFSCFFTPAFFSLIGGIFYRNKDAKRNFDAFSDPIQLPEHNGHLGKLVVIALLLVSIYLNITNFMSVGKTTDTPIELFQTTLVSAHRGSEWRAPENTMSAIAAAVEDMADFVEIDVQLSKDGHVVLLHDNSLLRTAGVNKLVGEMTLRELKKLDMGSWFSSDFEGEQIPTLEEVIQFVQGKAKLNIEIKSSGIDELLIVKIAELIEQYDFYDQCVISSFSYPSLMKIKMLDERIQTGLILIMAAGNYLQVPYIDFFSLNAQFVTKGRVQQIHNNGFSIHVWSADSSRTIRRLLECGVDNLITSDPLRTKQIILSHQSNPAIMRLVEFIFGTEQVRIYREAIRTPPVDEKDHLI